MVPPGAAGRTSSTAVITDSPRTFGPASAYGRLAAFSLGGVLLLVAVGYLPTRAMGGGPALVAMAVGLVIALVAALAGLAPPIIWAAGSPRAQVTGVLIGMGLRFVLTLGLTLAALLSRMLPPVGLAVWVVIAYLVLMTIDTIGLVRLTRSNARANA